MIKYMLHLIIFQLKDLAVLLVVLSFGFLVRISSKDFVVFTRRKGEAINKYDGLKEQPYEIDYQLSAVKESNMITESPNIPEMFISGFINAAGS